MFLIGAAYFVAGSYPESLTMADLDSAHSMHHTTGNTAHGNDVGRTSGSGVSNSGEHLEFNDIEMNDDMHVNPVHDLA